MKTKAIFTGAVVLVVFLFAVFLLIFLRKPPQDITVRHVKSVQSGDLVRTFEISNHTTSRYAFSPVSVEVRKGQVWKTCFDWNSQSFPFDAIGPHASMTRTLYMTNLPTGSPLRLRMGVSKELAGFEVLFRDLRFRGGLKQIWINPFAKTTGLFYKHTEILSDEFVDPR